MPDPLSTVLPLWKIAPMATIVVAVIGIGFYAGMKSRDETINTLKEWIESLRRK